MKEAVMGPNEEMQDASVAQENEEADVSSLEFPGGDLMAFQARIETLTAIQTKLKEELAVQESVVAEERDKRIRGLAELENFKRRKEQEVSQLRKFASESVVLDILPILDNVERACDHIPDTAHETVKELVEGMGLIKKQFHSVLEKMGVKSIEALNAPFDPHFHQGVMQEPRSDVDSNTVVKVVQTGYTLHEKVIRPSMVVVSTTPEDK
jgi:molecular chaperone GrpE